MMKPKKQSTSRYEVPFHLLSEEEKSKTRERELQSELRGHVLIQMGGLFACSVCGQVYIRAGRSRSEAEMYHRWHVQAVKEHINGRTAPDWS
jgi:hypothetical protein